MRTAGMHALVLAILPLCARAIGGQVTQPSVARVLRDAILDRQVAEHAGLRQLRTTHRGLAFEVAPTYTFSVSLRLHFHEFFSNLLSWNSSWAAVSLLMSDCTNSSGFRAMVRTLQEALNPPLSFARVYFVFQRFTSRQGSSAG
jgi:hypothetical protein